MRQTSPSTTFLMGLWLCGGAVSACAEVEEPPTLEESRFDLIAALASATVSQEQVDVDIGTPEARKFLGNGWAKDGGGGSGGDFAWGLGEASVLRVPLSRPGHVAVMVRCRPFTAEGLPDQSITLVVNGTDLGTLELEAGWSDHRVVAPAGVFKDGSNRVELRYAWSQQPNELGVSADTRDLAVAFDHIRFLPDVPAPGETDDTPRRVHIDLGTGPSRNHLVEGWGGREGGKGGATYSWVTAQAATVSVDLGRAVPTALEFSARPFMFEDAPDQVVTVALNGEDVGDLTLMEGWNDYALDLSASVLQQGANDVTFRFSRSTSPAAIGTGGDPRTLAAAFGHITLEPHLAPAATPGGQLELLLGSRVSYGLVLPPDATLDIEMPDQDAFLVVELEVLRSHKVRTLQQQGTGELRLSEPTDPQRGVRLTLVARRGEGAESLTLDRAALLAVGDGALDFTGGRPGSQAPEDGPPASP